MGTLAVLRHRGFDRSYHIPFTKEFKVLCSACSPTVINGTPCHERGCPNQGHECRECGDYVPADEVCGCMEHIIED